MKGHKGRSGGTGFTPEQKRIILERDKRCQMRTCQKPSEVANHRGNRGSGGYGGANRIANGCGLCHYHNLLIEVDAGQAGLARYWGIKISRFADPATVPMMHREHGRVYLRDDGSVVPVEGKR